MLKIDWSLVARELVYSQYCEAITIPVWIRWPLSAQLMVEYEAREPVPPVPIVFPEPLPMSPFLEWWPPGVVMPMFGGSEGQDDAQEIGRAHV